MSNKKYIEELIQKTIDCPSNMTDSDILKLYNDIQNVFTSNKYSEAEKNILHKKAHLESLAMMV